MISQSNVLRFESRLDDTSAWQGRIQDFQMGVRQSEKTHGRDIAHAASNPYALASSTLRNRLLHSPHTPIAISMRAIGRRLYSTQTDLARKRWVSNTLGVTIRTSKSNKLVKGGFVRAQRTPPGSPWAWQSLKQLTFSLYTTNTTHIVIIERGSKLVDKRIQNMHVSVLPSSLCHLTQKKLPNYWLLSPGTIQCSSGDSCSEWTYWDSSETVGGRSHCQPSDQGYDKYCVLSSYSMIAVVLFWETSWNTTNLFSQRGIPPQGVGWSLHNKSMNFSQISWI